MLSLVTVDEGSSALSKTTGLNYSIEINETGKGLSFSGNAINSPQYLDDRTLVLVDTTNNQPIDSTMNSPLTLNLTLTPPPLDDNSNATGFIAGEYAGNMNFVEIENCNKAIELAVCEKEEINEKEK